MAAPATEALENCIWSLKDGCDAYKALSGKTECKDHTIWLTGVKDTVFNFPECFFCRSNSFTKKTFYFCVVCL